MPPRASLFATFTNFPKSFSQSLCRSCFSRSFVSTRRFSAEEKESEDADADEDLDAEDEITPEYEKLQRQTQFFAWLEGPGANFRHPLPGSTNYLSAYDQSGQLLRAQVAEGATDDESQNSNQDKGKLAKEDQSDLLPFPNNKNFISQSILSESLRLQIWSQVQEGGRSVREVSADMGVEMRRVAAVVRLVEIERRMKLEGKQLALPYARAVHAMVPLTELNPLTKRPVEAHESINDIEQHPLTFPQIFYPTSESRAFNRTDAGRVFSGAHRLPDAKDAGQGGQPDIEPWQDTKPEVIGKHGREKFVLKPTDSRIPHPHLIAYAKDKTSMSDSAARQRYRERLQQEAQRRKEIQAKKAAFEELNKTRINTGRWQFVVTDVEASKYGTGANGRGLGSPGYRYGVPSQDRKKGHVKIPTKVEV